MSVMQTDREIPSVILLVSVDGKSVLGGGLHQHSSGWTRMDRCHLCHIVPHYHLPKRQRARNTSWAVLIVTTVCCSGHLAANCTQSRNFIGLWAPSSECRISGCYVVVSTSGPDVSLPDSEMWKTMHLPHCQCTFGEQGQQYQVLRFTNVEEWNRHWTH